MVSKMNRRASIPKAKIKWKSPSGVLLILATLSLVSFASWCLMSAGTLKEMRRSLSERNQWLGEVTTAIEFLETPPMRAQHRNTRSAMEKLTNDLENLKLSLSYPHEPFPKLMTRIDVTIVELKEELQADETHLASFRKQIRNHLRRAQTSLRSDVVARAKGFTEMAKTLNQTLSGAGILAGFSLMLLVNLILRSEEWEMLKGGHDALEEELNHLTRSQKQHYRQTFASITDNLEHGVIVYRRGEILFANRSMFTLIRPGAKKWEDVEPELDLLIERIKKGRQEMGENHEEEDKVHVEARRFDGSSITVLVHEDMPTIYRGGDAQMVFIFATTSIPVTELQSA